MNKINSYENIFPFSQFLAGKKLGGGKNCNWGKNESFAEYTPLNIFITNFINDQVFGAKPLEDVVRNMKSVIMSELESALSQQAPNPGPEDPSLHELPPVCVDGIPTPVEKMTQVRLKTFLKR